MLVELSHISVNLVNIYAPTNLTERKAFFACLHEFFIPADALILGDDFNCYESDLDKFGGNVSVAGYFSDFGTAFKLVDIWRKHHSKGREMSWLDKYLLSSSLTDLAASCDITPCCFSDYEIINLCIVFSDSFPRGPGTWKFNNSLHLDETFCDFLNSHISDLAGFKVSLRADIITYAKSKRKRLTRDRFVLTNQLIYLKQRLLLGDTAVRPEILAAKSQLAALVDRVLEGAKIRS